MFKHKYTNNKNYCKVKDHCHYTAKYRGAAHGKYNLKYSIPEKIHVVFHSGLNYDYWFIMKELAKEIEGYLNCLRENTEQNKTFLVPITKEVKKIHKNGEKITKTMSFKLQFIDSARFIA